MVIKWTNFAKSNLKEFAENPLRNKENILLDSRRTN